MCRLNRATMGAVVAAAVIFVSGCTTQTGGDERTRTDSQNGFVGGQSLTQMPPSDRRPAPVAAGPALSGDGTVSTADYPDKVVVVNVWGSWCAPCRKEAPDLVAASRATADIAQFVGIDVRDYDPAPARAFIRAFKVPYPQIYDPRGAELLKFSDLPPSGIPSTLIIDRQGRPAARVIGTISKASLTQMVTAIAAEE